MPDGKQKAIQHRRSKAGIIGGDEGSHQTLIDRVSNDLQHGRDMLHVAGGVPYVFRLLATGYQLPGMLQQVGPLHGHPLLLVPPLIPAPSSLSIHLCPCIVTTDASVSMPQELKQETMNT